VSVNRGCRLDGDEAFHDAELESLCAVESKSCGTNVVQRSTQEVLAS